LRFSFEKKFTEIADATEMYLKQSYHSITFPAVAAIITFPAIPTAGSATTARTLCSSLIKHPHDRRSAAGDPISLLAFLPGAVRYLKSI
jgi:hypothetical protein